MNAEMDHTIVTNMHTALINQVVMNAIVIEALLAMERAVNVRII